MRKQTKIAALVSAAALLAIGASVTSLAAVGWQADSEGEWQWFDSYGDPVYDQWKQDQGKWYYLGEDGYMYKNQVFTDDLNHTFWVDGSGEMQTGKWLQINNTDNVDVNGDGHEEATLYMYFGNNGIAYKADSGKVLVKEIKGLKYVFNDEGYMMNNWVKVENNGRLNIYYCGDEDDGHVRIGWKKLPIPDGHVCPDTEAEEWFYFRSDGRAYVQQDGEQFIDGKWYSFNEEGCLRKNWTPYSNYPDITTPPNTNQNIYNSVNGSNGYGWQYAPTPKDSSVSKWYYLVSYNDGSDGIVHSIAFNSGTGLTVAKTIKEKVYLFSGDDGRMLTGLQVLPKATPSPVEWKDPYSANFGEIYNSTAVTELPAGIYYFEDPRNEKDSTAGQMVTGKVTYEYDDGYTTSEYYFARSAVKTSVYRWNTTTKALEKTVDFVTRHIGQAYQNAIVDSVLYGPDGRRIQAEDGGAYAIVNLDSLLSMGHVYWLNGSKAIDLNSYPGNHLIVVNNSGRVKTSGTVKIDGNTYKINTETLQPILQE